MRLSDILKRENNNIDLIRLFAALLVVWHHANVFGGGTGPHFLPHSLDAGGVGVATFFFFSGMLVTNSLLTRRRVVPFALSRFFRIFPAYAVVILLSVFLIGPVFTSLGIHDYFKSSQTWDYLLKNLCFVPRYDLPGVFEGHVNAAVNGSIWSLPTEIGCYMLLLVSYLVVSRFKVNLWIPIAFWLLVALVPTETLLQTMGVQYVLYDRVCLFCFVIGSIMAVYQEKIRIDVSIVGGLLLLSLITWRYENVCPFVFMVMLPILLLFVTSIKPLDRFKPRHDISYGVYLWHWPVMQMIFCLFGGRLGLVPLMLISTAITIAVSFASCVWVETPMIGLGRRLSRAYTGKNPKIGNGLLVIGFVLFSIVIRKMWFP